MQARDFMDERGRWTCTKCGACCRVAGRVVKELDRGDGACKNLTKDNLCGIYEDRPAICRTQNFPAKDIERAFACAFLHEMVYA